MFKIATIKLKIGWRAGGNASTPWRLNQYRATIMIATTMNAATSERARSSDINRGFAASGGGIA